VICSSHSNRRRLKFSDLLREYPELCCTARVDTQPPKSRGTQCLEEWTRTVMHGGQPRKVCWLHEQAYRNPERLIPVRFI